MRTFKNQAAQGDCLLRRIDTLPANAVAAPAIKGRFTLAHSETGHDHVVMERPGVRFHTDPVDQFRAFLTVDEGAAELVHLRDFDTHETLSIGAGVYEVRRQREYTAEGFRRAQD